MFKAGMVGIPLPLCSCGVVPTALSLRKEGASRGATVSFLISTPETGVDSIAISYALLGPIFAIFRPISAAFTAIIAGLATNWTTRHEPDPVPASEPSCCCSAGEGNSPAETEVPNGLGGRVREAAQYAFGDLLRDLAKWIVLGMVIAGAISAFPIESFIENYLGSGIGAMLVMMVAAVPVYICATASTPVAAALLLKGLSPGAALVFLLAGPATNAATLTVLFKTLGKRTAATYLSAIAVCSLVMGLALDGIFKLFGNSPVEYLSEGGVIPHSAGNTAAFILAALLLWALIKPYLPKVTAAIRGKPAKA